MTQADIVEFLKEDKKRWFFAEEIGNHFENRVSRPLMKLRNTNFVEFKVMDKVCGNNHKACFAYKYNGN